MKRFFDVIVSGSALLILAPFLVVLAMLVRRRMGSPVIFRQQRPGLRGKPFIIYKFRTMRDALGPDMKPLSDAERLTPFGVWLRRTSLDELPELWNILKGDMSLVGPRPLLMSYLPLYNERQARRHEVLPGLTGWAQINGRNNCPWDQRFEMDVWYVENHSFVFDLKILVRTVGIVLSGKNVEEVGEATFRPFQGSSHSVPQSKT